MAQKKIKCKVYYNTYEYGGGHWYLPYDRAEEIKRKFLSADPISKDSEGTFEFEVAYLDRIFDRRESDGLFWWDGHWCE